MPASTVPHPSSTLPMQTESVSATSSRSSIVYSGFGISSSSTATPPLPPGIIPSGDDGNDEIEPPRQNEQEEDNREE